MDENELEADWKILQRTFADTHSPSTLNMAEAIDRLTRALLEYGNIGDFKEPDFYLRFDHKEGLHRISIIGLDGKFSEACADYHLKIEQAMEAIFVSVIAVMKDFNKVLATDIEKAEKDLASLKYDYRRLERNVSTMGLYSPDQEPLPFTEPKAAAS